MTLGPSALITLTPQRFTIHWRDHAKGQALGGSTLVTVCIDDTVYDEGLITRSKPKGLSEGWYETSDTVRPYTFEKIKVMYSALSAASRMKKNNELGTIKLIFQRVKYKSYSAFAPQNTMTANTSYYNHNIPEGVDHVVSLGPLRKSRQVKRRINYDHIRTETDQYVFTFRYCSPDVLLRRNILSADQVAVLLSKTTMASEGNLKSEGSGSPQKRSFLDTWSDVEDMNASDDELEVKVDKAISLLKEVKAEIRKRDRKSKSVAKKRKLDDY
ncbi:hypothetical protein FRC02_006372 [Tulasnella sp. 418]|nr:hypothetical protein FRC02_006372 [Tulasnella sp. 418]